MLKIEIRARRRTLGKVIKSNRGIQYRVFTTEVSSYIFRLTGLKLKDYGSINPALYQSLDGDETSSFPEDHLGRLWLRLAFERESEKLVVTLVKGKNLPCRRDKSPCDPFVR